MHETSTTGTPCGDPPAPISFRFYPRKPTPPAGFEDASYCTRCESFYRTPGSCNCHAAPTWPAPLVPLTPIWPPMSPVPSYPLQPIITCISGDLIGEGGKTVRIFSRL